MLYPCVNWGGMIPILHPYTDTTTTGIYILSLFQTIIISLEQKTNGIEKAELDFEKKGGGTVYFVISQFAIYRCLSVPIRAIQYPTRAVNTDTQTDR